MDEEQDLMEEIKKLRDKAHYLSNTVLNHEGRIIHLEEDSEKVESKLDTLEKTMYIMKESLVILESQSKILRWLLGVATAIFISLVGNYVKM
jgi:peptidoglycan hydrolase CwlO-like protein